MKVYTGIYVVESLLNVKMQLDCCNTLNFDTVYLNFVFTTTHPIVEQMAGILEPP